MWEKICKTYITYTSKKVSCKVALEQLCLLIIHHEHVFGHFFEFYVWVNKPLFPIIIFFPDASLFEIYTNYCACLSANIIALAHIIV